MMELFQSIGICIQSYVKVNAVNLLSDENNVRDLLLTSDWLGFTRTARSFFLVTHSFFSSGASGKN